MDPLLESRMIEQQQGKLFDAGGATNGQAVAKEEPVDVEPTTASPSPTPEPTTQAQTPPPAPQEPESFENPPSEYQPAEMTFFDVEEEDLGEGSAVEKPESGEENFQQTPEDAKENAETMAELALDFLEEIPPLLGESLKIPTESLEIMAVKGQIPDEMVEKVKELNKENQKAFKLKKENRKMIKKPLVKVLEKRGVNMPPEVALIMAVVVTGVSMFMQYKKQKETNDTIIADLQRLIRETSNQSVVRSA